ncbi:portal protein, partial [Bacillus cereus]
RTMWKVRKNAGVDMHTLFSAPGNIVTTNDMTAVEALQVPDVTGPTFVQTMNYLTSALQNGTGITVYTMGINTGENTANKTATGTRLIQQEANAQFKLKIQLFNHMVIQRVANQFKDLRIQYTTESQKLRIIGNTEVKYMAQK